MKNRRDFVKMLALLAAGAAARPEQIEAFERYYDANTPRSGGPFIAVDELWLSGLATVSTPLRVTLYKQDETPLRLGLNAFGGVIRWLAAPDQKQIAEVKAFRWRIEHITEGRPSDDWVRAYLEGHISYIDQEMVRRSVPIGTAIGRLT